MIETRVRYEPVIASPPGDTLALLLEDRGMTQADLAQRTGRPRKTINEIVKGKQAITAETALQFDRVLGTPASYWIRHEGEYQAFLKRQAENVELAEDADWFRKMPFRELKQLGVVPDLRFSGTNKAVIAQHILTFFGVASRNDWEAVYGSIRVAYRQSEPEKCDLFAARHGFDLASRSLSLHSLTLMIAIGSSQH